MMKFRIFSYVVMCCRLYPLFFEGADGSGLSLMWCFIGSALLPSSVGCCVGYKLKSKMEKTSEDRYVWCVLKFAGCN